MRISDKANFTQELSHEREKVVAAIEREIDEVARTDQSLPPEFQTKYSKEALRNSILLVIALGGSQYFWLCYWRDSHGGAYVSRWKVIQIERETYTARGGYEVEHYRALIEKVS